MGKLCENYRAMSRYKGRQGAKANFKLFPRGKSNSINDSGDGDGCVSQWTNRLLTGSANERLLAKKGTVSGGLVGTLPVTGTIKLKSHI
jgi:hypothetical protein